MKKHNNKFFIIIVPICIILILAMIFYDRYQTSQLAKKYNDTNNQTTQVSSNNDLAMIYCVGDSLTLGTNDVTSYPDYLKESLKNDIEIIGDNHINSQALAIKLGNQDVYVNNFTIPSDTNAVSITLLNENGEVIDALINSQTGIESCIINNIAGTISYDSNSNQLLFKRLEAGDSSMITTLTKIEITKPEILNDNILILFTGSYEESIQGSLVNYQKQIIDSFNTDKYIVVSLTIDNRDATNNLLANTYGEHYLDFKNYLLTNGLNDAKITATSEDQMALANNSVPSSLLIDDINGNNYYHQLLANQLINKMHELGYIN